MRLMNNRGGIGFLCRALVFVFCFFSASVHAAVDAPLWHIADEADWGSQAAIVNGDPSEAGGRFFNVAETHARYESDPAESVEYQRYVYTINNVSGLEDSDGITVDFDPSFQTVVLHKARIIRKDEVINQLFASEIQVLHREKELESGLYNGLQTLHLRLNDQRVGDRVEYSFSIRGRNPVFADHIFGWERLQASVPVGHYYFRLRYPQHKKVITKIYAGDLQPLEESIDDYKQLTWVARNTQASRYQSDTPSSFFAETYLQYSDFSDWESVSAWADSLYRLPQHASAPVRQKAAEIVTRWPDDLNRQIDEVINFVQDDIRYTGINIGIGGYVPDLPEQIIQRRFGDCKDKAILMVALLRELGVTAYPALVHSYDGQGLSEYLPSPGGFNHMIVKLPHQGRDYWVDGTMTLQGSSLTTLAQGLYHHALVADGRAEGLQAYEGAAFELPQKEMHEEFSLRHNVETEDTLLKITTTYRGAEAEYIRASLQSSGRSSFQKNYLNYYRNRFGQVELAEPLKMVDDRRANELILVEQYHIAQVWEPEDDEGNYSLDLFADSILDLFVLPSDQRRFQPLAVRHPLYVKHRISVQLEEGWGIEPESTSLKSEFFDYHDQTLVSDDVLELSYSLQTSANVVPVNQARTYIKDVSSARDSMYYTVTFNLPVGTEKQYFLDRQLSDIGDWFRQNAVQIANGEAEQ